METNFYRRPVCKIVAVQPGRALLTISNWGEGDTINSWIDDEDENDDKDKIQFHN